MVSRQQLQNIKLLSHKSFLICGVFTVCIALNFLGYSWFNHYDGNTYLEALRFIKGDIEKYVPFRAFGNPLYFFTLSGIETLTGISFQISGRIINFLLLVPFFFLSKKILNFLEIKNHHIFYYLLLSAFYIVFSFSSYYYDSISFVFILANLYVFLILNKNKRIPKIAYLILPLSPLVRSPILIIQGFLLIASLLTKKDRKVIIKLFLIILTSLALQTSWKKSILNSYSNIESNLKVGIFDGYYRLTDKKNRYIFDESNQRLSYNVPKESITEYLKKNPSFIFEKIKLGFKALTAIKFYKNWMSFKLSYLNIIAHLQWIIVLLIYLACLKYIIKDQLLLSLNTAALLFYFSHAFIQMRAPYFFFTHFVILLTVVKYMEKLSILNIIGTKIKYKELIFCLSLIIILSNTAYLFKQRVFLGENNLLVLRKLSDKSHLCSEMVGAVGTPNIYKTTYFPVKYLNNENKIKFAVRSGCTHILTRENLPLAKVKTIKSLKNESKWNLYQSR